MLTIIGLLSFAASLLCVTSAFSTTERIIIWSLYGALAGWAFVWSRPSWGWKISILVGILGALVFGFAVGFLELYFVLIVEEIEEGGRAIPLLRSDSSGLRFMQGVAVEQLIMFSMIGAFAGWGYSYSRSADMKAAVTAVVGGALAGILLAFAWTVLAA
jgi:uncharacterized membrane protein YeaQ/YmgE (transglycosylase-associated protein family)